MVLTESFKNAVIGYITPHIDVMKFGTDGTVESESDTALKAIVSGSTHAAVVNSFNKGYSVSSVLVSGSVEDGSTLKEGGIFLDDGTPTMHSRFTFYDFAKTGDDETTFISIVHVE